MYKAEAISKCYDALVIGSGIAGLLVADLLSQNSLSVLLVCKGKLSDSNTSMAQGGLAAVTGANPVDSPELHLQDTLSSGAGLTDEAAARTMVSRGRDLVQLLDRYGVNFDRSHGALDMALEGGHSRARVLHSKDASGRAISSGLIESLRRNVNLTIWEDAFALDLLVEDGMCSGASILIKCMTVAVRARHTVLATGGLGQVFSRTTNPAVATGDGIAMAYRAGARLIDMEFVQFHPTALSIANQPAHLISEAVRGAGATLLDEKGQRFVFNFHKDGELATRDVVAKAIYKTMLEQGTDRVWLDMRPIGSDQIADRFPNIFKKCMEYGFDPRTGAIPIAPAAHYFMGGIWTDIAGNTTVPGLYAIGECASTGLHGANRLASNSLLEGGVMALQLAENIAGQNNDDSLPNGSTVIGSYAGNGTLTRDELRKKAFESVGLERDAERLNALLAILPETIAAPVLPNREAAELSNVQVLLSLITSSAIERKESRGAHQRVEFPKSDDMRFRRRLWRSIEGSGWLDVAATDNFVHPAGLPARMA